MKPVILKKKKAHKRTVYQDYQFKHTKHIEFWCEKPAELKHDLINNKEEILKFVSENFKMLAKHRQIVLAKKDAGIRKLDTDRAFAAWPRVKWVEPKKDKKKSNEVEEEDGWIDDSSDDEGQ